MNMVTREADITSVFDEAVQAHNAGDLTAAEQLYKETLSLQPDHCEANHNIGVVFASKNELEDALKFFKFALDTSPNVSLFWASYIDVLIKLDRITESKTLIKALTDAGISCDKIKDISHKLNVLHQEPGAQECDELDELINQKKFDDAQEKCLTLLETYPSSAVLNVHLGKCYFERGHIDHAISCYTKATQYQPKWEVGFAMLAQVNSSQGNLDQAIAAYEKVISLKPDYAEAYNNMGIALQDIGKVEEAIEAYQRALSIDPKYADAHYNMGNALAEQGKPEKSIKAYKKALTKNPNHFKAWKNLGDLLADEGKLEKSIKAYKKALTIKPDYAEVHRDLSTMIKYKLTDPQITIVQDLMTNPNINKRDKCSLHYTYGKMNEDIQRFGLAFENYTAGGALRKEILSYDFEQDQQLFEKIKANLVQISNFALKKSHKSLMHTPIFILGMPRSGTTLVEQIVSSHSNVHGAGELYYVNRLGTPLSIDAEQVSIKKLEAFRLSYLEKLRKVSKGMPFVTDKMPHNFLNIALLISAIPEAKIILTSVPTNFC